MIVRTHCNALMRCCMPHDSDNSLAGLAVKTPATPNLHTRCRRMRLSIARSCRHALSLHNLKRRKKGPDGRYINPPAHMRKPAITSRWQEPPGPPELPDRMLQVLLTRLDSARTAEHGRRRCLMCSSRACGG